MQIPEYDRAALAVSPVVKATGRQQIAAAAGKTLPEPNPIPAQQSNPAPPEQVEKAISAVNQQLAMKQHSVRLVANPEGAETIIEVVDKSTNSVIRQIPSEAVVKLSNWWAENGMLSADSTPALAVDETA